MPMSLVKIMARTEKHDLFISIKPRTIKFNLIFILYELCSLSEIGTLKSQNHREKERIFTAYETHELWYQKEKKKKTMVN